MEIKEYYKEKKSILTLDKSDKEVSEEDLLNNIIELDKKFHGKEYTPPENVINNYKKEANNAIRKRDNGMDWLDE